MDLSVVLIALLMLGVGAAVGWLAAQQHGHTQLRDSDAAMAQLRAELDTGRELSAHREELLMRGGELASVVTPLRESLAQVQQQLAELDRGRAVSDTALREQVRAMSQSSELLRNQTSQLVTALRAPQVRGRWGEMQLERVVEAAGMVEHVDFERQVVIGDGLGGIRPDLVVQLTAGRNVVVDSKVALTGYLAAAQAPDEATRNLRLNDHARQLRKHIDDLSSKAYWERCTPTPEFVVCFVPGDAFLDSALQHDPALLEYAFGHNVVLATPSTLVALLRTVAYTWRQDALATNANEVHELGRELYLRLTKMGSHIEKLGKNLAGAVSAYNEAVGSLEHRVMAQARKFETLGVTDSSASIAELRPLTDSTPRAVSSPAS